MPRYRCLTNLSMYGADGPDFEIGQEIELDKDVADTLLEGVLEEIPDEGEGKDPAGGKGKDPGGGEGKDPGGGKGKDPGGGGEGKDPAGGKGKDRKPRPPSKRAKE